MSAILQTFRWIDLLDIILVSLLVTWLLSYLKNSLALRLLMALIITFLAAIAAEIAGLDSLHWVLDSLLGSAVVVAVVVFQTDIRRSLVASGRSRPVTPEQSSEETEVIEAVSEACASLAARSIGALIVLERGMGVESFIEVGTEIDAKVTSELLTSIFLPYSPIHDGAVIIRKGKLTQAGCFLPLTRNPNISKNLGTRHRAAIGLSELVDAAVVVVSEETGAIAIVTGGKITRDLDAAQFRKFLQRHLGTPAPSERDGHA